VPGSLIEKLADLFACPNGQMEARPMRCNLAATNAIVAIGMALAGCTIIENPSDPEAIVTVCTERIKTYPFADPDPMPILARSDKWCDGARLYPYSFFDKLSKSAAEQEWTVVRMENPHIALALLPEVGGKIWGAVEKSTGREFVYTNHVLKFREIALRGPWVSGGIEFNFGIIGHTPAGATPVDYMVRRNRDGSASCFVGTLDLPSRTRWCVEIFLPADRACFETRAQWYNPSPLHQSYYAWMNSAVRASDDLQYSMPGRFRIGHDYSVPLRSWPVDGEGRDLSLYGNNDFGSYKSYFTIGEYEHFFGGYWKDSAFGFGHYALYDDMPGRKVWIWGLSPQGAIWEDLLTDADGQYTEPQAGRLLNQSDHAFFAPYTTDRWRETWFPYKEIGPLTHASPMGVMNVERKADVLRIRLCAIREIDEEMTVNMDKRQHASERIRLRPMEVLERDVPLPAEKGLCTVKLGTEICYTSDPAANDLDRPFSFHDADESSTEGLFLAAAQCEKSRDHRKALKGYTECVERDPNHLRARCRIAELRLRRGEYALAHESTRKALEISMYDAEANYIHGIVCQRLGKSTDAKAALGWAARSMAYRSAAYCRLAEIHLSQERYDLAVEYTRRALDSNRYNFNASLVRAIALRKDGNGAKAGKTIDALLEVDPLNHAARFERYLLNGSESLQKFRSMFRSELPHEHLIETALFYLGLGATKEAVNLFELARPNPVACYWLAFIHKDDGAGSRFFVDRARDAAPGLVFPFREETIPVLTWVMERYPGQWTEAYYLGLIYWSKGRIDEAIELFSAIEPPDFAPFYLARAHLIGKDRPELAGRDLEKALALDGTDRRCWHRLLAFYLREGSTEAALMAAERFADAAVLFEGATFLPAEGATGVRDLFAECHLRLALEKMRAGEFVPAVGHLEKSKTFPENLGSGRPYDPDQRMENYLLAICHDRLGRAERAESLREGIIEYTFAHEERDDHAYFAELILTGRGRRAEAEKLANGKPPPEEVLDIIELLE